VGVLRTVGNEAVGADISTDAAACVLLGVGGCDVTLAAEEITTVGFGSIGALVAATGDTNINVGVLRTGGDEAAGLDLSADPNACVALGVGACDTAFTIGELTTSGANAPAALVRAAGDIDADIGVLRTEGNESVGLDLASDPETCAVLGAGACDTSFSVGQLTTEGTGATGILARTSGATTGNVGVLRTRGADATGVDIAANPTSCVLIGAGACDIGLTANEVSTTGDGAAAVLIGAAGNVVTDLGLLSTAGDDATALNIVADPAACLAFGPGSCVVTAAVDEVETGGDNSPGIVVETPDDVTVDAGTVNTAGADSSGVIVTTDTGAQVITAGPVRVRGLRSNGIVATSETGDIAITAEDDIVSDLGVGIIADTGGAVNITTLAGADVSGGLGGIDATSGLGTRMLLRGAVSGGTGPAINVDGAAADILVDTTGAISGRIDLTDAADRLVNNGTFAARGTSNFGAGFDVLTNNGRVNADGAVTLAGLETFNNNALIDMVDGAANDVLTLPGAYTAGAGATLAIDVDAGTTGTPADRLVIDGVVTGTTTVDLNFDEPGVVNLDGTVIVDAGLGTGNFVLGGTERAGFVDFSLGANAAGDTLLFATPNARAIEVALLPQFGQTFWYRSADAWSISAAQRRNDLQTGTGRGFGIWGQGYMAQEERGDWQDVDIAGAATRTDLRYETDYRGLQGGIDFRPGDGPLTFGITGGYQKGDTDLASGTDVDFKGWNVGGYMLYGAPQGLYAELLAKVDFFDLDLNNGDLFAGADLEGKSYGAEGEIGFRTQIAGADVDLGAGLAYVKTDIDGFEASNAVFELDDTDSLRGQLGVRISGQSGAFRPFADFRAFHEFLGDNEVRFISGGYTLPLSDRGLGTSGRIEIGVEGPVNAGGLFLSTWGELGDTTSYGVRAGFRF